MKGSAEVILKMRSFLCSPWSNLPLPQVIAAQYRSTYLHQLWFGPATIIQPGQTHGQMDGRLLYIITVKFSAKWRHANSHVETLCTNQYYPWNVPYIELKLILNWAVVLHNSMCCALAPCTYRKLHCCFLGWNKLINFTILGDKKQTHGSHSTPLWSTNISMLEVAVFYII